MTGTSHFYIDGHRILGDQAGGWQQRLDHNGHGLPPAASVVKALDPSAFAVKQAVLLIEDGLLFPLRIQLEQAVKARERTDFLKWKLKRLLPYPIDQVSVRAVPLAEENAFLTFSLPDPWVQAIYGRLREAGVHLGYIGGMFTALLENRPLFRGGITIAFFREIYLIAELDDKGAYLRFHSRRVPFDGEGAMDVDTVLNVDLMPILEGYAGQVRLLNLAPERDADFPVLAQRASAVLPACSVLPVNGGILERYGDLQRLKAVPA